MNEQSTRFQTLSKTKKKTEINRRLSLIQKKIEDSENTLSLLNKQKTILDNLLTRFK